MVSVKQALVVRVILSAANNSWIIEKMANRLAAEAENFGCKVEVGAEPDPDADVNHWMSYAFANVEHNTPTTMLITHLDDPFKMNLVKGELRNGVDVGICLSSDTVDLLVADGVEADCLAFVVPGHDFAPKPRRIRIGLTTRLYADGRKREAMLVKLAGAMRLDAFRFEIFGHGWDGIIGHLEDSGAEVFYRPGTENYVNDYQEMIERVAEFDYYLYLGRDEGSLGAIDALAAGVKTIITPQGFHVDLPHGITHAIWTDADLLAVFQAIEQERSDRVNAVASLTWYNYAKAHVLIWQAVVNGQRAEIGQMLSDIGLLAPNKTMARRESLWNIRLRYLHPYRIRSAISHIPALRPIRDWLLRRRQSKQ